MPLNSGRSATLGGVGGFLSTAIAIAHGTTPFVSAYPFNLGFGTKYANPATLPGDTGKDVAFSTGSTEIGMATSYVGSDGKRMSVYNWAGGFGSKLTGIATGARHGEGFAWQPGNANAAFATITNPHVYAAPFTPATGFGSTYANPSPLPGQAYKVNFSPDGGSIALAIDGSPAVNAYAFSSGFGSKYANPGTIPGGNGADVEWSKNGSQIAIGHSSSPYISVYVWSSGFGAKYANPSGYTPYDGLGVTFSHDDTAIAIVKASTPFIQVYPWSPGFGTKYSAPAVLPAGSSRQVSFSANSSSVAVAHDDTPFVTAWPWSAGFGTKYANPATLPAGYAQSLAFNSE